jgi:methylenetetrahydrofolate reductase (NADPH)
MSFPRKLTSGEFPFALEITPPQRSLPAVLLRRASLIGHHAAAVNVIQRPERQSSLAASCELLRAGMSPAWHLVTRGRPKEEIAADLATAKTEGIGQVLVIAGDHRSTVSGPTIREVVEMAAAAVPGAFIGATLNQYVPDRVAVLRNLMPKLAAGARYVQTQPVFSIEDLRPLAEAVKERSPGTMVVPMVMPLETSAAAERIAGRLGISPPAVASTPEGAWAAFGELLMALKAGPLFDGVAIMTFEIDPPPETGSKLIAVLDAVAGAAHPGVV